MKKNLFLLFLISSSLICMEPKRKIQNELAALQKTLETLESTLQKSTKKAETSWESLPSEMIDAIIAQRIPKKFFNEQEIIDTITTMFAWVNSCKTLKQYEQTVKNNLGNAIKASSDIISPRYKKIADEVRNRDFAIARTGGVVKTPITFYDKYKIINLALHKAFEENNFKIAEMLIKNGANINTEFIIEQYKSYTLLSKAVEEHKNRWVKFMLELIDEYTFKKMFSFPQLFTPLDSAEKSKNKEAIRLICEKARLYNITLGVRCVPIKDK